MAQQQDDVVRINDLDYLLRPSDVSPLNRVALTGDDRATYAKWYSHLLSSLALLSAGDELIFGQAEVPKDSGDVRVVVITTSLVLTAEVDTTASDSDNPFVSVLPRTAIESFKLRAGQGVDVEGSRKYAWPESLVMEVRYRGLVEPLELWGSALKQNDPKQIGPIWRLLGELRSDLTRRGFGAA